MTDHPTAGEMRRTKWLAGLFLLGGWAVAVAPGSARETRAPAQPPVAPAPLDAFATTDEQLGARRTFVDVVKSQVDGFTARRKAELAALNTPEEWKAAQTKTRQRLSQIFGGLPARTPLNARTVGKLEREAYTIEKVIFESQPKYYVTANLYIPKGRKLPMPGIVFPCGHSDSGKACDPYQLSGSGATHGVNPLIATPSVRGIHEPTSAHPC